jgi:hypothetical protein
MVESGAFLLPSLYPLTGGYNRGKRVLTMEGKMFVLLILLVIAAYRKRRACHEYQ